MEQITFPPQNDKEFFDVLQFIRKSPFAKDYWKTLKGWYKQTETALLEKTEAFNKNELLNILGNFLYRIDQEPIEQLKSPFPTKATLAYMKRRGRRLMRNLKEKDQEAYFSLASKLIIANTAKEKIDYKNQWILLDVLFGNSKRFEQISYKGEYVHHKKYHLNRIEDSAPEVWDNNIPFVNALLEKEMPWQIYEFAIKVLYRNNAEPPTLNEELLQKFLESPSDWLKRFAVQKTYQIYTYQGLKPQLYAGLWLYSNAYLRKEVESITQVRPELPRNWWNDMAKALSNYIFLELNRGNATKRVTMAIKYLKDNFEKQLNAIAKTPENAVTLAPALLNSGDNILIDLALEFSKQTKKGLVRNWCEALGERTDSKDKIYKKLANILEKKVSIKNIYIDAIEKYIYNPSFYACDFGWRLSKHVKYIYGFYQVWQRLVNHQNNRRMKEVYFTNTITSQEGAYAFIRYYGQNGYNINGIPTDAIRKIFEVGLPDIQNTIINKMKQNLKGNIIYQLGKLAVFPEDIRKQIFDNFLKSVKGKQVFKNSWQVRNVSYWDLKIEEWKRDRLFDLIENTTFKDQIASNFLSAFMEKEDNAKLFFAFLEKSSNEKLKNSFIKQLRKSITHIQNYSHWIPAEFVEKAFESIDLGSLLRLVSAAPEDSWKSLQKLAYQKLQVFAEKVGFWKSIFERLQNSEDRNLRTRLVEDEYFFEVFQQQKDALVLDIQHPEFEEILFAWAKNNTELFKVNSIEILKICKHKLPKLRNFGLEIATKKGITPFMCLQLLESQIPDTIQTAKAYLDTLSARSEQELDIALMMIDSPSKEVRGIGLDFVGARRKNFEGNNEILAFLSEHSDAGVQAFVAEEINQAGEILQKEDFVKQFDSEVLRMKNRSRKAKETVKKRIENSMNISPEVLLEMAKSSTKQDAEWAIAQLAKLSLSGEEIEGFSLQ